MRLLVNQNKELSHINPEIYGHFSEHLGRCIYEGIYVGENSDIPNKNGMRTDVVEALKELKVPVLRWPGGCFADEYHWRDGIGPKETRKKMINTHWGGVVEDNSFGTHEFFELCEQLGCKTYVNGNLGSGTVQEMSEWVEYMTFDGVSPMADLRKKNGHEKPWKIDYFGVGNENWGCGGNMLPAYYANEYRRYQTYVRNYNGAAPISKVCCGANAGDYNWTKEVMNVANGTMNGLSLHYYTVPAGWSGSKGSATDFNEEDWYTFMAATYEMETLITRHGAIMDQYDPEKKVGMIVDEWGAWYDVEPGTNPGFLYQQNTMRDALIAAINLNIFNNHSDRVKMANLAQMVNVLASVILTEGDKMIKTPTYHVMHMYRHHQDAELIAADLTGNSEIKAKQWTCPQVTSSVSKKEGIVTITLSNASLDKDEDIKVSFAEDISTIVEAKIVTADDFHAMNTFESPDVVTEKDFDGAIILSGSLNIKLPRASVVEIRVK